MCYSAFDHGEDNTVAGPASTVVPSNSIAGLEKPRADPFFMGADEVRHSFIIPS